MIAATVIMAAMHFAGAQEVVRAELDVPFELKVGQSAVIESEDIEVSFERVVQDSRCPSDVTCIWEGQATIGVFTQAEGIDKREHLLTIGADESPSATFG
jgi:hypothetical protein